MPTLTPIEELKNIVSDIVIHLTDIPVEIIQAPVNGTSTPVVSIKLPPSASIYIIPSQFFPEVPPAFLVKWDNNDPGEFLTPQWDRTVELPQKIQQALSDFVFPSQSYRSCWGHDPATPLTENKLIGELCHWKRFLSGAPLSPSTTEIASKRIDPEVVQAFATSDILLVGLGSVGSYMAEQFVRTGIGSLSVIDFDTVQDSNLSRTAYERKDLGVDKPSALERRLYEINPSVTIRKIGEELRRCDKEILREMFTRATVVVATTDDPSAQALINTCSQYVDKPSIYVGLYREAKGGEVVVSVPGLTPCFRCQVGASRLPSSTTSEVQQNLDYGTHSRLQGEMALGCDIQHVASSALKITFSLICALKNIEGPLQKLALTILQKENPMLTMGMEPDYWFFPQIFDETPGQLAFQSVWLNIEKQSNCPDCGVPSEEKEDVFASIAGSSDVKGISELLNDGDP